MGAVNGRAGVADAIDPPERRLLRAGVRQVALLAGVSPITVSRALAEPSRVAPETRKRIAAAVEATGYIPNRIAGSLSSNRTRIVAAIVPTLRNSIPADFIDGVTEVLRARGYQLLLGSSGFSVEEEESLVLEFLARRVDGIYLTGATHTRRTRDVLRRLAVPTVEVACLPEDPIDMAVGFSNQAALFEMTSHLAARGYRRIAFFSGPTKDNERQSWRLDGYRRAVHTLGLDGDPALVVEMPMDLAGPAAALDALWRRRPDVQAIVCTTDVLALGAIFECQRRGVAIPGQLAIAGFEDMEIASFVRPTLTTVRIARRGIGARAAEMLLDRIAGQPVPQPTVDLGFEIVQRETT
jgi:LacI family gluconate utilization system Gnt-I transcriptional repressor